MNQDLIEEEGEPEYFLEDECPICGNKIVDIRHVGVECFYDVSEITPKVEQGIILSEVEENSTYWGTTRHYPKGTRDDWDVENTEVRKHKLEDGYEYDVTHHKLKINQKPIDKIRLIETAIYRINCCKSCRSDFLFLFKSWVDGGAIDLYELKRNLAKEYDVDLLRYYIFQLLKGVP